MKMVYMAIFLLALFHCDDVTSKSTVKTPANANETISVTKESGRPNHYLVVPNTVPKVVWYVTTVNDLHLDVKPSDTCKQYVMPQEIPPPPQPELPAGVILDAAHRYALLSSYVASLQLYIQKEHELQNTAYSKYVDDCKTQQDAAETSKPTTP